MLHNTNGTIRTFTGQMVNVLNPDPEQIFIEDIAHALSNICRFGGHTRQFYSVAQHSVMVAQKFDQPYLRMSALLHDAAEAYLLDLPRPIKVKMLDYQHAETVMMQAIAKRFGLQLPMPKLITGADDLMLNTEWLWLMTGEYNHHDYIALPPAEAKQQFLDLFIETDKKISSIINSNQAVRGNATNAGCEQVASKQQHKGGHNMT